MRSHRQWIRPACLVVITMIDGYGNSAYTIYRQIARSYLLLPMPTPPKPALSSTESGLSQVSSCRGRPCRQVSAVDRCSGPKHGGNVGPNNSCCFQDCPVMDPRRGRAYTGSSRRSYRCPKPVFARGLTSGKPLGLRPAFASCRDSLYSNMSVIRNYT